MILGANQTDAIFRKATPAMSDPMLPLPGLSPVSGKNVIVKFDGGLLSSDGGILTLREIESRLRVAERMAACIEDPRASNHVTHSMADIIRFRMYRTQLPERPDDFRMPIPLSPRKGVGAIPFT